MISLKAPQTSVFVTCIDKASISISMFVSLCLTLWVPVSLSKHPATYTRLACNKQQLKTMKWTNYDLALNHYYCNKRSAAYLVTRRESPCQAAK